MNKYTLGEQWNVSSIARQLRWMASGARQTELNRSLLRAADLLEAYLPVVNAAVAYEYKSDDAASNKLIGAVLELVGDSEDRPSVARSSDYFAGFSAGQKSVEDQMMACVQDRWHDAGEGVQMLMAMMRDSSQCVDLRRIEALKAELQCCAHTFAAMGGSGPAHAERINALLSAAPLAAPEGKL